MKTSVFFTAPVVAALSFASIQCSAPSSMRDSPAHGKDLSVVQKGFEKSFPNLKTEKIRETPIKGIYEVVLTTNDQVMYYSPEGYVFTGDMWSKAGTSLTAQRKDELIAARAKSLPLDKALKMGSGKKAVIEFIDPESPFSRAAYQDLSMRKDVTQYVFFYPLETTRPNARKLAKYVLCSRDRTTTLDKAMRGELDGQEIDLPGGCEDDVLDEQVREGQKLGINSTPVLFVQGKYAGGKNVMEVYPKLLSQSE